MFCCFFPPPAFAVGAMLGVEDLSNLSMPTLFVNIPYHNFTVLSILCMHFELISLEFLAKSQQ